jgi:hypothetical protein
MAIHIRREEILSLLGGVAAVWSLTARGQPRERVRRGDVLTHFAADDPEGQHRPTAFEQGMRELGWAFSRNLQIDYRWAAGYPDRFRRACTGRCLGSQRHPARSRITTGDCHKYQHSAARPRR